MSHFPLLCIPRRFLLGAAIVATYAALSCGVGFAAEPLSMTIHEKEGTYDIQGTFQVQAETSVIWDVLTAYEQIPHFVGTLKKSHVTEDLGVYHFLLQQEFEDGFLFFTKRVRVLLDVHEVWYQRIQFDDIDKKDFQVYEGSWELGPTTDGSQQITYALLVKPNFSAPFQGDFIHGGAQNLLDSVRREILRRQDLKRKDASSSTPALPTPGPRT